MDPECGLHLATQPGRAVRGSLSDSRDWKVASNVSVITSRLLARVFHWRLETSVNHHLSCRNPVGSRPCTPWGNYRHHLFTR